MNGVLIRRTMRDYLILAAGATALIITFAILFVFATNSIPLDEGRKWLQLEWVRRLINAMIGGDLAQALTPAGVSSFVYTHPVTWVLIVAFTLTSASGVLSGQMDRGTMDLLATLPVSRRSLYASVSTVIFLLGLPIVWGAWAGVAIGSRLIGVWQPGMLGHQAIIVLNLYAAYFLIASAALAVSASCERRGIAIVYCFIFVLYSFVLNLLAAFWPAAQRISFTGLFHYYAPLPIAIHGEWPLRNMGVLALAGIVFWIAGWIRFCRRDIHVT